MHNQRQQRSPLALRRWCLETLERAGIVIGLFLPHRV
jgi:hypothetical protein